MPSQGSNPFFAWRRPRRLREWPLLLVIATYVALILGADASFDLIQDRLAGFAGLFDRLALHVPLLLDNLAGLTPARALFFKDIIAVNLTVVPLFVLLLAWLCRQKLLRFLLFLQMWGRVKASARHVPQGSHKPWIALAVFLALLIFGALHPVTTFPNSSDFCLMLHALDVALATAGLAFVVFARYAKRLRRQHQQRRLR